MRTHLEYPNLAPNGALRIGHPLRWLGHISYSTYLHVPLMLVAMLLGLSHYAPGRIFSHIYGHLNRGVADVVPLFLSTQRSNFCVASFVQARRQRQSRRASTVVAA
jgi:peptidoglycan/LPS O-acetylase OafA/YrhL